MIGQNALGVLEASAILDIGERMSGFTYTRRRLSLHICDVSIRRLRMSGLGLDHNDGRRAIRLVLHL